MTDPERFSRRSTGLAAELLQAAAKERPSDHGMQQTLLALGLSGAVLSGAAVAAATAGGAQLTRVASASAATSSVGLTSAGTIKTVSATLIIKWVGIGVLGGVGLAGVATVASPMPSAIVRVAPPRTAEVSRTRAKPTRSEPRTAALVASTAPVAVPVAPSTPRVVAVEPRASNRELDLGERLAAEVAYVDRARSLLAASPSSQGLSLLEGYEQKFHEARLLPEVLFLQIDAYERAGRSAEARRAAQRLVDTFPKSPHVGRARKLLDQ